MKSNGVMAGSSRHSFAQACRDQNHLEKGATARGRTLADVLLSDGLNLNQELVKDGWCWWYRKYAPGDTELERLEKEA